MSSISSNPFASLQSIMSSALQNAGVSTTNNSAGVKSPAVASDTAQLSPAGNMMQTLQQLQQSNPAEYKQVTQQIATNLQKAAQTAQSDGNTSAANQLNQLASSFTTASQSGQLPSLQDPSLQAGGTHHHHHHGHHSSQSSTSSSSSQSSSSSSSGSSSTAASASSDSSTTSGQLFNQLVSALQNNESQSASQDLNPMSIIQNTLANPGIGNSNS